MVVSTQELAEIREIVRDLLETLQLETYLFEVEPKNSHWQIRLERGLNDQWQSLMFEEDFERLMASKTSGQVRKQLLAEWQKHLGPARQFDD